MEQPPSTVSSDDRTWGMLAHLLAAGGHFLVILSWLGPLIVWITKRDISRFAAFHGLQSLLFQLMCMAILAVLWLITFVLMFVLIGFALVPIVAALHLVPVGWAIFAAIKAYNGEWYQYPIAGPMARRSVGV